MIYSFTDSLGQRWQTQMVETAAASARPLYYIPHDKMRYDYDDRPRKFSQGWKYNPALTGKPRQVVLDYGKSMPEVYRSEPWQGWQSTQALRNLIHAINPELSYEKAMTLLDSGLAFCNGEFGRFDGPRIMGGWTVAGREDGNKLWLETIRADQPLPSASQVLADPTKWGWCVSVRPDNQIGLWQRKGLDGNDHPVRMMLMSVSPVWVPLDEVKPVEFIHEPQWMG